MHRRDGKLGVDQRQRQGREAQLSRRLEQHHRVVALDAPRAVGREDRPGALHPESLQLGSAQGADTGRAEDADALGEQVEDFLVPHGRGDPEATVDQPHRRGRIVEQPREVAADGGRAHLDAHGHTQSGDGRPGEQHRPSGRGSRPADAELRRAIRRGNFLPRAVLETGRERVDDMQLFGRGRMIEHHHWARGHARDGRVHQLHALARVTPRRLGNLAPLENPVGDRERRADQRPGPVAPRGIVLRNDVVARAGDERGAALRRLAQRPQRCARRVGMAGAAAGRRHGVERGLGPEQLAGDDRHAVRLADAPQARGEASGRHPRKIALDLGIGNVCGPQLAGAALEGRQGLELGDAVVLEQLAQRREARFLAAVAGREAIRIGGIFERRAGEVERQQVPRHGHRFARAEHLPFDPAPRQRGVEIDRQRLTCARPTAMRSSGQRAERLFDLGLRQRFGGSKLAGFEQRRHPGRERRDALALGDGQGTCGGPDRLEHRQAKSAQPGDVGQPRHSGPRTRKLREPIRLL